LPPTPSSNEYAQTTNGRLAIRLFDLSRTARVVPDNALRRDAIVLTIIPPERTNPADATPGGRLTSPPNPTGKPLLVCIHGGGSNGNYFDLKGCSLRQAAVTQGFPTLLIDRPGYCGSPEVSGARPIRDSVAAIGTRIRDLLDRREDMNGVVLIGHSIGGAIALMLAASGDVPVRAVAVSGIGDVPHPDLATIDIDAGGTRIDAPPGLDALLFETGGHSLNWRALASLRRAAEPWLLAEIREIVEHWPADVAAIAGRITVPVQLRLAEHERLWQTGETAIARLRSYFVRSPQVDAALLMEGGHIYEACKHGPAFIAAQLAFVDGWVNASAPSPRSRR
jgi:pimeloyl-ACP methyl ester carboxylesterase